MTDVNDSKDLVIIALKQRIGELASHYELDIANIRAQYTMLQNQYNELLRETTLPPVEKKDKSFPSVEELVKKDESVNV